MSEKPPKMKTPAPPKTRSGEMAAVKSFQEEIEKYNEEVVPQLDVQVDRMNELFKKVSTTPVKEQTEREETPIPLAPRPASFVDPSELEDETFEKDEDEDDE